MLQPDVLLLDEPTNHLDLQACLWLEDHLSKFEKILFIISHAQDFLNGVCTKIIHFQNKKLEYYSGNYDQYIETATELAKQANKRYVNQQKDINHIKEFANKFGAGTRSTQVKSRVRAMEKMIEDGLEEKP